MEGKAIFLPKTTGPYTVGCADVVSKYDRDRILCRLFYPTSDEFVEQEAALWLHDKKYLCALHSLKRMQGLTWAYYYRFVYAKIRAVWNGEFRLPHGKETLPVIIISHGWSGNRFIYSSMCCDLASHGNLVVALEHGDHSASSTYYLEETDNEGGVTVEQKWIEHKQFKHSASENFEQHSSELSLRTRDCVKVLDHIEEINQGSFRPVQCEINLSLFKGNLDLEKVGVIGHGFGGTTVASLLTQDRRFKVGVILDGMMTPVESMMSNFPPVPLLFINCSEKCKTSTNADIMNCLVSKGEEKGIDRAIVAILGAVNLSHTDFPLLINKFSSDWHSLSGTADRFLINKSKNKLTLEFLNKVFDKEKGELLNKL